MKCGKPMKRSRMPRAPRPIKLRGRPRHAESGQPNEAYREHIRGLPCVVAAKLGHRYSCMGCTHPHHVRTRGAGGTDAQMAPLCVKHHDEVHYMGRKSFAAFHGVDLEAKAAELWRTYQGEHAPT